MSNPHWWMVLPYLLLTFLTSASDPLMINDLIVRRYERYYGFSASVDAHRTACRESATSRAHIMPMFYCEFAPPIEFSFRHSCYIRYCWIK